MEKIRESWHNSYINIIHHRSVICCCFDNIKTIEKEDIEYGAEILAFSDDGTLMAEFTDTYRGGIFFLSDGNILVEEELYEEFGLTFIENPDELQAKLRAITMNNRRIAAVEVLIEDQCH